MTTVKPQPVIKEEKKQKSEKISFVCTYSLETKTGYENAQSYMRDFVKRDQEIAALFKKNYGEVMKLPKELFVGLINEFNFKTVSQIHKDLEVIERRTQVICDETAALAQEYEDLPLTATLINEAVRMLNDGNSMSFISILRRAASLEEQKPEADVRSLAKIYAQIGARLIMEFRFQEASQCYIKADQLDPTNPAYALAVSALGNLAGNQSVSIEYGAKVKEGLEATDQTQTEEYAEVLNNIGAALEEQGDIEEAVEYYQKALTVDRGIYGESYSEVALRNVNIGLALQEKGEYNQALDHYQKALRIDQGLFGELHPSVASDYVTIGSLFKAKGEDDLALDYYKKALKIDLKVFGEEHPGTARDYNNVGAIMEKAGKLDEAIENYQKSLDVNLNVYGERHPSVAIGYNNLGTALHAKQDFDEALKHYQKALEIDASIYGRNHPRTASRLNNVGGALWSKGELDKALNYYGNALNIFRATYGENHDRTATGYNNLGMALWDKGDLETAGSVLQKALTIFNDNLGPSHHNTNSVKRNLGFLRIQKTNTGLRIDPNAKPAAEG